MQTSPVPVYLIGTHRISCNDENQVLIIDSLIVVRFSSIHYKLIKLLVESSPVPVTNADLVQAVYASENWRERLDSLEKHFDNIRSKLRHFDLYAYRIGTYGYILLPFPDDGADPKGSFLRNHP